MGRNRKNKFEETSIRFEAGTEFEVNHVKVPFWVNVTYKVKIGKYNDGKSIYGTTTVMIKRHISEKDEIIKEFQKKDYKEINVEECAIEFSNFCPNCQRKGVPKVERKSNKFDYHAREIDPLTEEPKHKVPTNRRDEYWLCYDHKIKPKKCRVAKWDKNHFMFLKDSWPYRELLKYRMPYYVEWQEHGTVWGLPA